MLLEPVVNNQKREHTDNKERTRPGGMCRHLLLAFLLNVELLNPRIEVGRGKMCISFPRSVLALRFVSHLLDPSWFLHHLSRTKTNARFGVMRLDCTSLARYLYCGTRTLLRRLPSRLPSTSSRKTFFAFARFSWSLDRSATRSLIGGETSPCVTISAAVKFFTLDVFFRIGT